MLGPIELKVGTNVGLATPNLGTYRDPETVKNKKVFLMSYNFY